MKDAKFYHYNGLSEFARGCQARRHCADDSDRTRWAGGSREDALRWCKTGDTSKVAEAERLLERLDTEVDSNAVRPMWTPSVVGNFPLVPAYLAGTPEAMLARTDVPDARGEIEIWANTTVSCSCNAHDMMRRGVVTMAFAMALSRARNVTLVLYGTVDGSNVAIRLASPLDVSEVCAAFCQPSITRQLIYGHATADGYTGRWAAWAEANNKRNGNGAAIERKALMDYAGMPADAVRLGTEKLGSYARVTDDELVEILNGKLKEVAGKTE